MTDHGVMTAVRTGAMSPHLDRLVDSAWEELDRVRKRHATFVPQTCAPVLFFGNVTAYADAPLRVATVGLNPSDREFPRQAPWLRFPAAHDRRSYLESLSGYFQHEPLDWFGCFREVLRGLDASFFADAANRAVHTDICSVVPTAPTWSQLPLPVQRDLADHGLALWHELVAALRPHVLVASVRYAWLDRIAFPALTPWEPLHFVDRTNPYLVEGRRLRLPDGSTTLLVRGRAANTPFGTISNPDRFLVGQSIRRFL